MTQPCVLAELIVATPGVADDGSANCTDSPEPYGPNGFIVPSAHFARVRQASIHNARYRANCQPD
jgi:hypothetical protein